MPEDKIIICKECKTEFLWTGKEQEFYASKGFYPPRRCKRCITTGYKADDGLTAEERQVKYAIEHPES